MKNPCNTFRHAALWLAVAAMLSACGGGGGGGGSDPAATGTVSPATTKNAGSPTPSTPDPAAPALSPEATAVQLVNNERTSCGFGALKTDALLNQAALNHAEYNAFQASINILGLHVELSGQPFFTGVTLGDRALHVGYAYREIWENVTTRYWRNVTGVLNAPSLTAHAEEQMRALLTTVYHLKGMVVPTRDVGMAVIQRQFGSTVARSITVELGSKLSDPVLPAQSGVLSYPCEGTRAAFATFTPSGEVPNPKPGFVGAIGTPIYLRAPAGNSISVTSQLVTEWATGRAVPAQVMTLANDPVRWLGNNDAFVLPDAPLTPGVRYRVRVSGMAGAVAYSTDFSFTPS